MHITIYISIYLSLSLSLSISLSIYASIYLSFCYYRIVARRASNHGRWGSHNVQHVMLRVQYTELNKEDSFYGLNDAEAKHEETTRHGTEIRFMYSLNTFPLSSAFMYI